MSDPVVVDYQNDQNTEEESTRAADLTRREHLFVLADEIIDAGYDVLSAAVWPKPNGTLGKAPLMVHGHLTAHRDRQLIRRQLVDELHIPPDVPLGFEIVVAMRPGSGNALVLDCDVKAGKVGKASLEALVADHGGFVTSAYRTPSGGGNVLLRKPPGASYGNRSPWPGIDVRADGGWIVAPGNVTSWGAEWKWVGGGFDTMSELPPGMAAQLSASKLAGCKATNAETVRFIEASPTEMSLPVMQKFAVEVNRFKASAKGSRHDALVHIVSWCFGMKALDLRWAMEHIKVEWAVLTAGEGREDEVSDIASWVVGQEAPKRAAAAVLSPIAADPLTGEIVEPLRNLPDEFWQRPELAKLRRWAHGRGRSADAVYGAVRARLCALVPYTLRIDTGLATPMSLNSLVALIARPGGGKTTSANLAEEVVPISQRKDVREVPMGSGEGIVEAFHETQVVPNPNGKGGTVKQRVKAWDATLLMLDEGDALGRMAERQGSTLASTLRSAWSGAMLGQANAKEENRRILAAATYRLVLLIGFQDLVAADFFADSTRGTPQRFVMFNANDPSIPVDPGAAAVPWTTLPLPGSWGPVMTLAAEVRVEVRTRALAVQRGSLLLDPLDAHRDQNRLKEAAMLAILDGRLVVSVDDWRLAGMVMDTSDALRSWVRAQSRVARQAVDEERSATAVQRQVRTARAVADDAHERAVLGGARAMARLAGRSKAPVTKRALTQATAGSQRNEASVEEMIERAEEMDWLRSVPDGDGWVVGGSKPS